jgi:hypothetical protein
LAALSDEFSKEKGALQAELVTAYESLIEEQKKVRESEDLKKCEEERDLALSELIRTEDRLNGVLATLEARTK